MKVGAGLELDELIRKFENSQKSTSMKPNRIYYNASLNDLWYVKLYIPKDIGDFHILLQDSHKKTNKLNPDISAEFIHSATHYIWLLSLPFQHLEITLYQMFRVGLGNTHKTLCENTKISICELLIKLSNQPSYSPSCSMYVDVIQNTNDVSIVLSPECDDVAIYYDETGRTVLNGENYSDMIGLIFQLGVFVYVEGVMLLKNPQKNRD